jgi:hypothetical protein
MQQAGKYFPYPITNANSLKFQDFITLFQGLALPQPEDSSDQRAITIFLHRQVWPEEWADRLIERISCDVLVDRKNQSSRALKVNPFFAPFLVQHFARLVPQLERLLVRS